MANISLQPPKLKANAKISLNVDLGRNAVNPMATVPFCAWTTLHLGNGIDKHQGFVEMKKAGMNAVHMSPSNHS